ncbi:MAG: strawberry notch family protein [Magnetococcales bacterium]|nr:strawberry notch family protein [Magnetococcales bacterium]
MASPTLETWLPQAKEANPSVSDEALTSYYEQKYGPPPSSLPTLQSWLPQARKANPEADDTALTDYWQSKYGAHGAREKESTQGDVARGFKDDFKQLPQLGYGLVGAAGAAAESVVGEGGIATGIKKFGVKGYEEKGKEIAAESKPSDSFNYAYDRAKEGDLGSLVDWAQYSLGHAGAQGVQALSTYLMGGPAGPAVVAGGKALLGPLAKTFVEKLVAKESSRLAATEAAAGLASEELTKLATANVARNIGQKTALALQATGMEGGEIGGDLAKKSVEENRTLSGEELAKGFGATLGAGALEFVGDKIGLDLVLGKSKAAGLAASAPGMTGRVARGTLAGTSGAVAEGATEFAQTLVEEAGKGNDPFSDASVRQAIDASAMGAVGGASMGGAGGILQRAQPNPLALPGPKKDTGAVDLAKVPESIGLNNPDVGLDESIKAAWDLLHEDTVAQEHNAYAAQLQAERAAAGPSPDVTIPPVGKGIPILPGADPAPANTMPLPNPSRLWMDEAITPGVEVASTFTPRQPSAEDARQSIAAERAKMVAMKANKPAAAAPTGEPPVAEGSTRLYRGESADNEKGGGWFTTDKSKAALYGNVQYVDVSAKDMIAFAQGHNGPDEFFTTSDAMKARARPLAGESSREVAPQVAPPSAEAAPIPSAVDQAYATIPELHALAKAKGLDPDTSIFKEYTKMVTGKARLDDLTPAERDKLAAKLGRVGMGDASKPAPPASNADTAPAAPHAAPTAAATVPRGELSPEHSADMLLRAEKAQADMGAAGSERGGRYFMDQDGHGSTPEVRGLKSATAPWYKELTKGRNPLKRDQIETAIQKIIQDDGVDVGAAVERVKEALLSDREFRTSPWGEDADAIMRGDWPAWIPKPEGYTPPQSGPTPSLANPSASPTQEGTTPPAQSVEAATPSTIDDRAHEAATSPKNDKKEPTQAQKDAENYEVGHDRIAGLNISIQNPEGSTRSGKDPNGKPWSVTMKSHYGYIRGTTGADKEKIDVFVKPNTPRDYSGPVFVVDQKKANGKFDEHKVMMGYDSIDEARARYKENYAKDWNGIQSIKAFTMQGFKDWLATGDTTQPAGDEQDRIAEQKAKLQEKKAPTVEKPGQQEIAVPPPTIGERPIIRPEAPLSETPLFSKGAQEPDAEQTKLPEDRFAQNDQGMNQATQELRALAHDKEAPGDVMLGSGRFVSLNDALRFVREGIQSGKIRPVPFQLNNMLDLAMRDANRLLELAQKPEEKAVESTEIDLPRLRQVADGFARNGTQEGRMYATEIHDAIRLIREGETEAARDRLLQLEKNTYQQYPAMSEVIGKILEGPEPGPPTDADIAKAFLKATHGFANAETRWENRRGKGLTDAELMEAISDEFGVRGGGMFDNLHIDMYGGKTPRLVVNRTKTLKGKELLELGRNVLKIGKPDTKEAAKEKPTATNAKTQGADKLADYVADKLKNGEAFTEAQLFVQADQAFGGTRASGMYAQKEAYDALELGINRFILNHIKEGVQDGTYDGSASLVKARLAVQDIRARILDRIPTQKANRTEDQNEFQQFSTPPDLAYVMNWAAHVTSADTMLEPSAGIGGIAVFAKVTGARVVMNEYHGQRADVLRQLSIGPVYQENAEQLNNILPDTTRPTVIVMNPPFSSTAGRKTGERSSRNVLRHLDQALARLEPGGRLVALIGQGRDGKDAQFLEEWKKLAGMKHAYRGRIGLSGEGYKKYGTTYNNQILIFDKIKPDGVAPINANVADVFEALPLLSEVRNARTAPTRENQSASAQSGSQEVATEGGRRDGSQSTVPPAAATVGARGERSGLDARQPSGTEGAPTPDRQQSPERAGQDSGTELSPARPEREAERPATPEPAQSGERAGSSGRSDASPGQPERSGERGPDNGSELPERLTVEADTSAPSAPVNRNENADAIFESYTPKKVKVKGAKPHPGKLVESSAMSAIDPPDATYKPSLPKAVIDEGRLSGAQLEPIVYSGQAHEQLLPDGSRRGFFDGDGTGVGKGREIAGILLDNLKQGRKKAVWLSKNSDLFSSAVRDWKDVSGTDGKELFSQGDMDLGETISRKDGILFSNYLLLGDGLDLSVDGKLQMKKPKEGAVDRKGNLKKAPTQTRLDQMVKWLGTDFDGVIVFDEAHEMRNNMQTSGGRGDKKPAMKALAGIELQKRFPKARIAYFSATGGIEVSDFGYAERLGMWGNGTPFANKMRFVGEIQSGGLAAMELVSQDLKANGLYTSRSLSYDDVTYDRLEHALTTDQREMYDEMAKGWQIALQNLNRIMEVTGADKNGAAKSSARSLFWGTHQRFYEQVLTSLQMPTVIARMEKDLEAGHAVVIQLTKTNAAQQDRQIKIKKQEGGDLDDLDLTPREGFLSYIEQGFPVQEFETYTDENGNERSRPVVDSNGAPVLNKEAVEMRDDLLRRLGSLRTPENPLDLIINTFGAESVAEVTGRNQRVVRKVDKNGKRTTVTQTGRTKNVRNKEAAEFMDDKRQILVFSDAGGTGQSYHASNTAKNTRRRMHYVIQPGWRADAAMQGLGRTHRTNQASAPHYVLVSTDLKGHKRFISTIARRLAQLGALTRGQRQTSSQGLFSEADNLENAYAAGALEAFFRALKRGDVKGQGWADLLEKLGLNNIVDKNGNIIQDKLPDVPQFLNRILSLEYADQNDVFDAFFDRMEAAIEMAKANGQFDSGMQDYRADSIELKKQQVVYENPETKSKTRLMTFEAKHRLEFHEYKGLTQRQKFHGFYIGQKTGKIYAALKGGYQHTAKDGKVEEQVKLLEPDVDKVRMVGDSTFTKNYRKISGKEAEKAWKEAIDKSPQTRNETVHILSGAMLGIWDRIGGSTRVYRVTTDDGQRTVGRVIDSEALAPTLERLGVKADKAAAPSLDTALDAIENGGTVELANGWKLGTRRVNGEDRIEVMGYNVYGFREELKGYGAFVESIRYEPRVFIPTENPKPIIEKIVKHRPILKIHGKGPEKGPDGGGSGPSFQRRDGSPGLGAPEMRALAGRIDAGDTRIVVSSFDALPNRIKEEAAKLGAPADEIRAVYDRGTVYLVEDRFESEADAEEAVFHELYHKWIAGHLGSSMQDDLNAMFDRMGGPESVLRLADTYQWREARAVMQSYAKRADLSRREKTAAVVNELLAEMGSRSINPTALQKIKAFFGAIRQWLRDHGLASLSRVTESDLLHLLERARSTHGTLKAQGDRPYFQSTAAHPTFYSQAALVVERKMPNKAAADQVRAILSPTNGVKPDELKWLGLDDYLGTKGTFTKQDVLDFIRQNEVQVEEVEKGKGTYERADAAYNRLYELLDEPFGIQAGAIAEEVAAGERTSYAVLHDRAEAAGIELPGEVYDAGVAAYQTARDVRRGGETKFSAYQLPGGQNYRELLLTLPRERGAEIVVHPTQPHMFAIKLANGEYVQAFEGKPSAWNTREMAEKYGLPMHDTATFTSSHFSEPNILAHVRFNDRTVDGKKVLLLEEVQSDWHQAGRKKGYRGDARSVQRWTILNESGEGIGSGSGATEADALASWRATAGNRAHLAVGARDTGEASDYAVPDAPFKKTWHELALKRMLRYAAEHGYDSLAWTTGAQQADRYDLSKHVEDIGYQKRGDLYNVTVWGKDGQQLWQNQSATLQQVEDTIGKELADKMQKGEGTKAGSLRYFSGLDLKVGGEGMEGFYDKILPAFLNKYGKKWGAKVGTLNIATSAAPDANEEESFGYEDEVETSVHALPITAAMKESVMREGQPLFQRGDAFKKWFGNSKVVNADGSPKVMYRGQNGDFDGLPLSGRYFTDSPEYASSYSMWQGAHSGSTVAVYIKAENIYQPADKNDVTDYNFDKADLIARGYDAIADRKLSIIVPLKGETQIKSAIGNRGTFDPGSSNILFQRRAADTQSDLPSLTETPFVPATVAGPQQSLIQTQGDLGYQLPAMSKMDDVIRTMQDKNIDLVRLVDTIKEAGHAVHDDLNPVLKEELYLGRVSKHTQDFLTDELRPLVDSMRLNKVSMEQLDEYLHARHAEEANAHLREINPDREDNEALSGMTNEEARRILAEADRPKMDRLAARVDSILSRTRRLLVDYGLESQSTVNTWINQYSAYVPLHREGYEDGTPGTGQGRSVRGPQSKSRTGSNLKVTNILANVAMDREKAIVRGEKMRPVIALAALLQQHPNSDLATLTKPADITYTNPDTGLLERVPGDIGEYRVPMIKGINRKSGEVEFRPDPTYKGRDNVVNFRLAGVDHAIVFNEHNDRAVQMARALKDLDVGQLNTLLASVAPATRYLASINTQFNPVFGVVNFIRDIQFAMLTLGTTPLAGKRTEVRNATFKAIKGIYQDARAIRRGEHPTSPVAQLWERFQRVGGPTGYRDMFRGSNDRAKAIEHMLNPDWWQQTIGGKILTAGGRLSGIEQAILDKAAKPLFEWLSDYNQAMENAVRLGVFQVGLESGMSDEQAASAAKNITVNFNKKGQITTQVGALYAFFNASVQGTARIAETLFEKGKFGVLSDLGKKIVQGGTALGALQAFALSMAGFEDEEPPEWMKSRSLIIPVPGTDRGYVSIPMPLGFNVLPNFGRLVAESLIHGKPIERAYQFISTVVDAFSPVGGASTMSQFLAPTAVDPFVALSENKDWTGRKIYREDFNALKPTPGMTRAKDTASPWAKGLAEAINWATGGTEYTPGHFSPTPDSIDYLVAQLTGGVGRETSKASQALTGLATGEEVPMHKIPLVGRLVGSASDVAARRNAFYDNLKEVSMHGEEVEGRRKHHEDASGYLKEHPDARLSVYAGQAERQVQDLNRRKRDLLRGDASSERVRLIDMQIDRVMDRFNERVKEMQAAR